MKPEKKYSGPDRSGICKCGCPWSKHHLGVITSEEYWAGISLEEREDMEKFTPQECESFGFADHSGMRYDEESRQWITHCNGYIDSMEEL